MEKGLHFPPENSRLERKQQVLGCSTEEIAPMGLVGKTSKRARRKCAMEPKEFVDQLKTCPYCQSNDCKYKYLNNGKANQPRYQCQNCKSMYTHVDPTKGTNGRPRGRRYTKERHVDPHEWQGVDRTCTVCGVQNNANFLYYNNNNRNQPRFFCHSCGHEFQLWPKRPKASSNQLSSGDVGECNTSTTFSQNENVEDIVVDLPRSDHDFVEMGRNANGEAMDDNYAAFLENELLANDSMEFIAKDAMVDNYVAFLENELLKNDSIEFIAKDANCLEGRNGSFWVAFEDAIAYDPSSTS